MARTRKNKEITTPNTIKTPKLLCQSTGMYINYSTVEMEFSMYVRIFYIIRSAQKQLMCCIWRATNQKRCTSQL